MIFLAGLAACSPADARPESVSGDSARAEVVLILPELAPARLGGEPLRVVATTSVIGDVVGRVGGEAIDLTVLMGPGQDAHSYEPAAGDLAAVATADVIFVNGWGLEEGLVDDLARVGESAAVVPISAGIHPLPAGEIHEDEGIEAHPDAVDPHIWFSIPLVGRWVNNAATILSDLDPGNADLYAGRAAAYRTELEDLQAYAVEQLGTIPNERRFLVTNHSALQYFARDHDLTVLGTVIPAASTLAEPSARDLADLIATMEAHGLCTIFTEISAGDALARTVAAELDGCTKVRVVPLYTEGVGPPGSYTAMMRANIDTIASGLQEQ